MRVIRQGDKGPDVRRWQVFLHGQGLDPGVVDGVFGALTHRASLEFQARHGLVSDGIVGNRTIGQAMILGFPVVADPSDEPDGANWPPPPDDLRALTGNARRARVWGRFSYVHAPVAGNHERIRVTDDWAQRNIVSVSIPQLRGIRGAFGTRVEFHREGADRLADVWREWKQQGLLHCVQTWDGGYVPRFIRGSMTELSNHAFGTAFDINAAWNTLGAMPALMGRPGCVRELVEAANAHGFYWGGHFRRRPDGMHFELAEP
jgi:hypothetical protein